MSVGNIQGIKMLCAITDTSVPKREKFFANNSVFRIHNSEVVFVIVFVTVEPSAAPFQAKNQNRLLGDFITFVIIMYNAYTLPRTLGTYTGNY